MIHLTALSAAKPDRPTVLTVGAFDGVHLGHQALIRDMATYARANGMRSAVLTFYPHPSVVLNGRRPSFYIYRPNEKLQVFENLGLDLAITETFSLALSKISAAEFVAQLQAALNLRELWLGADFALGHAREGSVPWLRKHGQTAGYKVHTYTPVELAGQVVSSSRVRAALARGDLAAVRSCLGQNLRVPGIVITGKGRGRTIGVPTANLEIWDERAYPANGVYAVFAWAKGRWHPAVANLGIRPTFEPQATALTIEAHLLDFTGDLYGDNLILSFAARLRPEQKFSGVPELCAQIKRDIQAARQLLATEEIPCPPHAEFIS